LTGIAEQPFYTKGEPREALVVWEMLHGGGWVLPLRNGVEIPSKPPLYHWLAALAAHATGGVSELAARLPSALLAVLAVLLVYWFGVSIGRVRSGWIAAVALLTSFEWIRAARVARVDMTLTFFLFASLLAFAVMNRSGVTRLRLTIFYACVALATLGKGPVGVALPALVIIVFAATRSDRPGGAQDGGLAASLGRRVRAVLSTVEPLRPVPGLVAVVLVAGSWYVAALFLGGESFFVKQILKENVLRFLDPARLDSGHLHGPLYFIPNFFAGALPWSLLAPAVAWWLWRMRPLDETTRFLVVWFVTVIVFFSLSASKRSVYVLPAYPAAALLLGHVLGPGPEGAGPRRLAGWGMMAGGAILATIGLAALLVAAGLPLARLVGPHLHTEDASSLAVALAALTSSRLQTAAIGLVLIAGGAGAAVAARDAHWLRGSVAIVAAMLALFAGLVAPVEHGLAWDRTFKPFMAEVRARIGKQPLAFYRAFDYGAVFYSEGHIRPFRGRLDRPPRAPRSEAQAARHAVRERYVLLWEDDARRLGDHLQVLLTSSGTGPKGRARLVLATPAE